MTTSCRFAMWGIGVCLVLGWTRGYPQSKYKEVNVTNGGVIVGTVKIVGVVPSLDELTVTKDDVVCGKKKVSPRFVIDTRNFIKNAVVFLDGIDRGKKLNRKMMQVFTQVHCEYQPHILVLEQGEPLEIVNSDPILHNVHAY